MRWTVVWTATAVWTMLALGAHGGAVYIACKIRCCTFLPHCENATSMNCDCPDSNVIRLRKGNIPATVEYIEISAAKQVMLGGKAVYDLHALRDLTVRDVQSLEVMTDGLALARGARLQAVRLERVREAKLDKDALSGHWPAETEVALQHVGHLYLSDHALLFDAEAPGPKVLLEHVLDLHAERSAFKATIGQLALVNVSMRVCQPQTFRGQFRNLSFLGGSIGSLEDGCVRPDRDGATVSISNCDIGEVRGGAVGGHFSSVLITASNVSRLHERALELQTDRLEVVRVDVREMSARALSVTACRSVVLMESRVKELRRDALAGLRLSACDRQREDLRPFTIHQLHVGAAEPGALALHPDVDVADANWDAFVFDERCSCALMGDLRALVGGGVPTDALSPPQAELADLVYRHGFCLGEQGLPERLPDAADGCPGMGAPESESGGGGISLDQDVVFYGVIAGVALLVVAVAAVVCVKRRALGRALGCVRPPAASSCGTLESRLTSDPKAVLRGAAASAASTLTSQPEAAGPRLPDLLRGSSRPGGEAAPEHIYAEIRSGPPLADYAEPRDTMAPPAGPRGETVLYAEIAPLVRASAGAPPREPPPGPPPAPPADPRTVLYANAGPQVATEL